MHYTIFIILSQAFKPNSGGVPRSTYKISSYLKQHGHNTHIFSYDNSEHAKQNVAELHYANQDNNFANETNNNQLLKLILSIKPDIIINQQPYSREIGNLLLKAKQNYNLLLLTCLRNTLFTVKLNLDRYLRGVVPKVLQPLIDNRVGKQVLFLLHKKKHQRELKRILDTYDYFVMFGPPNIQEIKYFIGKYKLEKTYLIPNSILKVESEVPLKEKRILWLGRLNYKQKRADLIIPLWKKIMYKLPDWQFDIVGSGEAYKDLENQIKEDKIPRIKLHGNQVPYKYYKSSPIYIMTSENEGFPNTLIEAQSFGAIPIVYDSYPMCSWLLKEGESGILIPPFDIGNMAKEIINIVKNKEKQIKLMNAALKNAEEYEINNIGKKWVDLFDKAKKNAL